MYEYFYGLAERTLNTLGGFFYVVGHGSCNVLTSLGIFVRSLVGGRDDDDAGMPDFEPVEVEPMQHGQK